MASWTDERLSKKEELGKSLEGATRKKNKGNGWGLQRSRRKRRGPKGKKGKRGGRIECAGTQEAWKRKEFLRERVEKRERTHFGGGTEGASSAKKRKRKQLKIKGDEGEATCFIATREQKETEEGNKSYSFE